jgi:hypothetical protein
MKLCRNCRKEFPQFNSLEVVCSVRCAMAYATKHPDGVKRIALKAKRLETREVLERLKPLTRICADAQKDVNRYVRIRDFGKGCISCDTGAVEDAGHFYPIGSKYRVNRLRFDTRAIHGQCRQCNSFKGGGNVHGYRVGLARRYGEEFLLELDLLKRAADQGELERLTKDEARSIAAEHRKMTRELERGRAAA